MRRLTSQALPGIMLVIVIFWALLAVIFLTGILASANRIENRVGIINSEVGPISNKLDTVPILTKVQDAAVQIREAAANLSPTIGRIANTASSIDGSLKSVGDSVGPINKSAKQINASVLEINKSVGSIAPALTSILGSAKSINGYVHTIDAGLAGTLNNVYDIRTRIVTASNQVDAAIRSAQAIKGDFDSIINQLGTAGVPATINGDAFRIEQNPLLLRSGNAGVMKEMILASGRKDPAAAQAGLPALDLLPQISALGVPAVPVLPSTDQLSATLNSLLQGLPLLADTGDLLSQVVAPK